MDSTEYDYDEITKLVKEALVFKQSNNVESAFHTIRQAVKMGIELSKPTAEYAHSLYVKAELHKEIGELSQSFEDYYQAYKIYLGSGNVSSAFHSLWHSAAVASENNHYKEAKAIFRKCLWMTQEVKLTRISQANFYRELAMHEERIDNLIGAYGLWLHCLSIYKEVDVPEKITESQIRIQEVLSKINH